MFGSRRILSFHDFRKEEIRIFSTFDLKKIRRFVNKYDRYYLDRMVTYDDFYLMRMVCSTIVMEFPYTVDIHVLIWAVIWLSSNGCFVPLGK